MLDSSWSKQTQLLLITTTTRISAFRRTMRWSLYYQIQPIATNDTTSTETRKHEGFFIVIIIQPRPYPLKETE